MKTKFFCLTLGLILLAGVQQASAQGTAFTYQGQLYDGGSPANGTYDIRCLLFTVPTGGSSIGTVTNLGVDVTNGLFVVTNDFGPVITGGTNWLRIDVRTNGASSFKQLSPRQQLTPVPYAIFAEGANAAGLSGTIPAANLSGTYGGTLTLNNSGNTLAGNGSGITGLNATQLTLGTVPDARLSGNVAFLNANQVFTGNNAFSGLNASLTLSGTGPISTTLFTGLGLQFYNNTGEGAILSSVNDANSSLSFYTKQGAGLPIVKQMIIDRYGGVGIDQQGVNSGFINNSSSNGVALSFGISSGEGIASQRLAGAGNQYGLDFYTDFAHRMSITQGGLVGIGVGTNTPNTQLEVNGSVRIDGHSLFLEPAGGSFGGDGLTFGDSGQPGINGGYGPCLFGYYGGALGALNPTVVALSWDANGNAWVNDNLSTGSLTVRGDYLVVDGGTPVDAYIGDDGSGNDVQIGSQLSGITAVSCFNTADQAYMHLYVSSITIKGGSDLAEPFQMTASNGKEVPQGAVVVIDDQNPGRLKMSDQPYDSRVAGVVSGANGINPGIQMQQDGLLEGGKNVALTGRVYVQADTSNGAIKPGDLLTSSAIPGRAMKVTDHIKAQGAILGKAMTGLQQGEGMVLVLVTLQ